MARRKPFIGNRMYIRKDLSICGRAEVIMLVTSHYLFWKPYKESATILTAKSLVPDLHIQIL